jgi:hypothetical protein
MTRTPGGTAINQIEQDQQSRGAESLPLFTFAVDSEHVGHEEDNLFSACG